ncbi:MAG: hypothetical protein ABEI07_00275 [Candidatus Nanohaloarchaea archaeon]
MKSAAGRDTNETVMAYILHDVYESGGETYLQDVYSFVCDDMGRKSHELWSGLNALSASGILESYEEGGRTVLELARDDWSAEEIIDYDSEGEVGEEWTDLYLNREWKELGPVSLPGLDTRLLEDHFRRNPEYGENDYRKWSASSVTAVAGYRSVDDGRKEYWTVAVNDREREEDRLALMARFKEEGSIFLPRHRDSYALELWTPVMVLQHRNSMVNQAVEEAITTVLPGLEGEEGVEERFISKLGTLARSRGGYEDVRDAAVSNYFGNFSGSKLLTPFSKQFELDDSDLELLEAGMEKDEVVGRKLPLYGEGWEKNRVNLEVYFDRLYEAAKQMDAGKS